MVRRGSGLVTVRRQCARPVSEDDNGLRAALDALAVLAVETVDGADHAGVNLVQGRAIKSLAATDVHPLLLTNLQRRHRQGPCVDLAGEHRPIRVDDLGVESRWPDFGARAVASTPVRSLVAQRVFHTGSAYAVFTVYADRPGVFDARTAVDSSSLVSQMARLLAAAQRGDHTSHDDQLTEAATVLVERFGINTQQALGMLHNMATERGSAVETVAREVLDGFDAPDAGHVGRHERQG